MSSLQQCQSRTEEAINKERTRLNNSPFVGAFNANEQQMIDLQMFMNQFAIAPEDMNTNVNFICTNPEFPCKYNVPPEMISELMNLLNLCYISGIPNQISECQYANKKNISSLFFDFIFETKDPNIDFESVVLTFSKIVFGILIKYLNIETEQVKHYVWYFSTTNPIYPTAKNNYQSKFRILIPSVTMSSEVKLFVYQRVYHSKAIKQLFQEKINYDIRDCLQTKLRNAPVTMAGSFISEEENEPMILSYIYQVIVSRENGFSYDAQMCNKIDNLFDNIVYEASVNYIAGSNAVIQKREYILNNLGIAKTHAEINLKPRLFFTMAYDDAIRTLKLLSITHPNATTIYEELNILDAKRFETFDEWLIIIKSLASAEEDYHCLAVIITYERAGKIIVENGESRYMVWDEFTVNWENARSEYMSNFTSSKYSWRSFRYWANIDNRTLMKKYIDKRLMNMITYDISHSVYQARLKPRHYAKYLEFMFGHMYITENDTTDKHVWYEFVVPSTKDREAGQLFKWRKVGLEPDSLIAHMHTDLQPILNMVLRQLKAWIKQACIVFPKDDPKTKYVMNLQRVFNSEIMVLFDTAPKRNILKETCTLFKNNSFLNKLDKIIDIIGVGNGVVELNTTSKRLLNYYHTYPITKYTDTNYIEYDENNKYIKEMYAVLRSLFPEDESDALDFLLYFFCTSLDAREKEALFIIIYGGGSNGKSVLMELFKNTLGEHYTRKLPLSFITEQGRNNSETASPALMQLQYARMAYYSESDRNEKVNAAKVKELTGGETISGRKMYSDIENFKPACNHIVTTNYRFIIESNDHATWRRFLCYRFKFRFAEEEDPKDKFVRLKNPELIDKIKKDKRYHEAFLAILMHYHTMLYQKYNGRILKVPKPTIDHETEEYRIREDIYERFISTRVLYQEDTEQNMDQFVENFRQHHSNQNGEKFVMSKEDMIHNFRNSSIGKYIKESDSGYVTCNLYSLEANEYTTPSSMLFTKWRNTQNSN